MYPIANTWISRAAAGVILLWGSFCLAEGEQAKVGDLEVAFDPATHRKINVTREDSGYEIRLTGLDVIPFHCAQPDSSVPIALPCGPNPYSHAIALFVAYADVDIEIELLDKDMELLASTDFGELMAGPYGVDFNGPGLLSGIYWVQVCTGGKPVGRAPYAFVGSE